MFIIDWEMFLIDCCETTSSKEAREIKRLLFKAKQNEILSIYEAREEEREKWQSVINEKESKLAEINRKLEEKDMELSRQAVLIEELKKQLAEKK